MSSKIGAGKESISIIVASHRPGYARQLAAMLDAAVAADGSAEAIIVADYRVEDLASTYAGITWIHHPDSSISVKRNRGIKQAAGAIVAFVDDDCMPAKSWIESGRTYLEAHPAASAVEGCTTIARFDSGNGHYREFKRLERPGFRTNNIFYRAAVLRAAGGFDERFTVQREDLDLAFAVIEAGGSIDFSESIVVEHRFRPEEQWDLLKNCWNRRFDPLLHKKHPALYRKYVRTPWTPSILVLLAAHCGAAATLPAYHAAAAAVIAADLLLALGIVMKKRRWSLRNVRDIGRAWISHVLAPLVLAAALVYGNVRFGGRLCA